MKWIDLRPLRNKTHVGIANALFDIFCNLGVPTILQCDNAKEHNNIASSSRKDCYSLLSDGEEEDEDHLAGDNDDELDGNSSDDDDLPTLYVSDSEEDDSDDDDDAAEPPKPNSESTSKAKAPSEGKSTSSKAKVTFKAKATPGGKAKRKGKATEAEEGEGDEVPIVYRSKFMKDGRVIITKHWAGCKKQVMNLQQCKWGGPSKTQEVVESWGKAFKRLFEEAKTEEEVFEVKKKMLKGETVQVGKKKYRLDNFAD